MKYGKLLEAHKQFVKNGRERRAENEAYSDGLKVKWDELLWSDKEMEGLFRFLNVWGRCHVEHKAEKLRNRFECALPYLKKLSDLPWVTNLKVLREVNSEKLTLQRIIQIAFDILSHGGPDRFGHVAASKLLHAYNPRLVVPWDGKIVRTLKDKGILPDVRTDGYIYAFKFLPEIGRQGEEAIQSYMDEHQAVDAASAILGIESEARKLGEPVTFAKLVDEYDWLGR